jgi:predicted peptidase
MNLTGPLSRATVFKLCLVLFYVLGILANAMTNTRLMARPTGFLDRTVTVTGTHYRYQVFVPANWKKSEKWPVILFLHGAGERGDDGLLQTEVGIGRAIRRNADRFPGIVVLPQCRKNRWWTEPEMEAVALEALEASIKEFNGDRARLYLTGLSMGGYGSWSIARGKPGKFAAMVIVCGGITPPAALRVDPSVFGAVSADPYKETAEMVGATPVWLFHGSADVAVPVEESRKMAVALKASNGNVRFTEYPGVGHNSWDQAYGEPETIKWLFSHKLEKRRQKE